MIRECSDLLFNIRRSIRYHKYRQDFFERCHNIVLLIALIFSSTTIISFTGIFPNYPEWLKFLPAVIVSIFTAVDLVLGFSRRSNLYSKLASKFIDLEKNIIKGDMYSEEFIKEMEVKRLEIEEHETNTLIVLNAICYNEQSRAQNMGKKAKLTYLQRILSNFIDLFPSKIKYKEVNWTPGL